jgi:3-oxoacyl-[acyl-carrier protein] reductase
MLFKNKVAIVTGGARGIGRAICQMLAEEGASLSFSYLNSSAEAQALKNELEPLGVRLLPLQLDVRDFEQSKELVEKTKESLGRLDILVNNAGIIRDKALMMMTKDEWQDVLAINLGGVFNVTRNAIVTFLKQKRGDIVNISSVAGITGMSRQTNYAASKAGIIGFTKSLAREVASYNIRVNAVAPGFIETDMLSGLRDDYKEKIKDSIPLRRFGRPSEVALAVRFLLSDSSSFITGQTIILDAGLSIQ